MRCLITGGAGFIGSHLSDVMLARGHDVHILDDLSTGAVENFAQLKSHPKFEYTIDSATNRSLVAELVDISDVVFRSEEHTSELQSRFDLVCRLLLEKKKK